jgi:hypothetical protein
MRGTENYYESPRGEPEPVISLRIKATYRFEVRLFHYCNISDEVRYIVDPMDAYDSHLLSKILRVFKEKEESQRGECLHPPRCFIVKKSQESIMNSLL